MQTDAADANPPTHVGKSCPCVSCKYNLQGLPTEGRCPECGVPVWHSLPKALRYGDVLVLTFGPTLLNWCVLTNKPASHQFESRYTNVSMILIVTLLLTVFPLGVVLLFFRKTRTVMLPVSDQVVRARRMQSSIGWLIIMIGPIVPFVVYMLASANVIIAVGLGITAAVILALVGVYLIDKAQRVLALFAVPERHIVMLSGAHPDFLARLEPLTESNNRSSLEIMATYPLLGS